MNTQLLSDMAEYLETLGDTDLDLNHLDRCAIGVCVEAGVIPAEVSAYPQKLLGVSNLVMGGVFHYYAQYLIPFVDAASIYRKGETLRGFTFRVPASVVARKIRAVIQYGNDVPLEQLAAA